MSGVAGPARRPGAGTRIAARTRRRNGAARIAAALVVLAGVAAPSDVRAQDAAGPPSGGRAVLYAGHVDLAPRFVGGAWRVQLRDDRPDPSVWHDLEDAVLHVRDAARVTVPEDPAFRFLGRPGAPVWVLPQVQDPDVVWPGWSTEDRDVVARVRGEVRWRLHGVEGPGDRAARGVALFLNDRFGAPAIRFAGARPMPQELGVPLGTHAHGNWVFPAPGAYGLDVELSATLRDGATVRDRRTLRFAVGDGDPAAAFAPASAADDGPRDGRSPVPLLGALAVLVLVVVLVTLRSLRRRAEVAS